jgi:hypothetical protein
VSQLRIIENRTQPIFDHLSDQHYGVSSRFRDPCIRLGRPGVCRRRGTEDRSHAPSNRNIFNPYGRKAPPKSAILQVRIARMLRAGGVTLVLARLFALSETYRCPSALNYTALPPSWLRLELDLPASLLILAISTSMEMVRIRLVADDYSAR